MYKDRVIRRRLPISVLLSFPHRGWPPPYLKPTVVDSTDCPPARIAFVCPSIVSPHPPFFLSSRHQCLSSLARRYSISLSLSLFVLSCSRIAICNRARRVIPRSTQSAANTTCRRHHRAYTWLQLPLLPLLLRMESTSMTSARNCLDKMY